MATLQIEHAISDFDVWKGAFERFSAGRNRAGVRHYRVRRPVSEPNYVMIDLDFDNSDQAAAFLEVLHREVWRSREASPALVGTPQTRIVEVALEGDS